MRHVLSDSAIEMLTDGIVLLDEVGHVQSANRSARPWVSHCMELLSLWSTFGTLWRTNKIRLPLGMVQPLRSDDGRMARCVMSKNGARGYALVLSECRDTVADDRRSCADAPNIQMLIGDELGEQIRKFSRMLRAVDDASAYHQDVVRQSSYLSSLLSDIETLSGFRAHRHLAFANRFKVQDVLKEMLGFQYVNEQGFRANFQLKNAERDSTPIYGNREWFHLMVESLLAIMAEGEQGACVVECNVRQLGNHVVANFSKIFDPRRRVLQERTSMRTSPRRSATALRLETCRQIAAVHGGAIKIIHENTTETDVAGSTIDSIVLSVPTGIDLGSQKLLYSCGDCAMRAQAEMYAEDLARIAS